MKVICLQPVRLRAPVHLLNSSRFCSMMRSLLRSLARSPPQSAMFSPPHMQPLAGFHTVPVASMLLGCRLKQSAIAAVCAFFGDISLGKTQHTLS